MFIFLSKEQVKSSRSTLDWVTRCFTKLRKGCVISWSPMTWSRSALFTRDHTIMASILVWFLPGACIKSTCLGHNDSFERPMLGKGWLTSDPCRDSNIFNGQLTCVEIASCFSALRCRSSWSFSFLVRNFIFLALLRPPPPALVKLVIAPSIG